MPLDLSNVSLVAGILKGIEMQSVSQDGPEMGTPGPRRRRPARELEVLVLALLVAVLYFSRLTDLTIRGEESRWARVAQEMISSGDWIVPRNRARRFPTGRRSTVGP